jgi:hypothetical protein
MDITAPERSLLQRMQALDVANGIRKYRAQLKRDVKSGRRSIVPVLREPEFEVDSMKVFDLLLAAPKVGRVKANKFMSRARISPSKTVGGLSVRQRQELLVLISPAR